MKRSAGIVLVTVLLLLVQGVAMRSPPFRADVATLVVVYLALEHPIIPGAALAFVVGYLADVFAGTGRGLYGLSMVILFFAVRLPVVRLAGARFPFITFVAVVSTSMSVVIAFSVEQIIGPARASFPSVGSELVPLLISAGCLGYPLYWLLKRLDERLGEQEDDFVFRNKRT